MNGLPLHRKLSEIIRSFFIGEVIEYLRLMRILDYLYNQKGIVCAIKKKIYAYFYYRLGIKLGFSLPPQIFGYGIVIPHYGTIVVGSNNVIGNYAVLHTSTCIASTGSTIGEGLYMSPGSKITKRITLGDAVTVGANTVVNKSCEEGFALLGGIPAKKIKESTTWWVRDGDIFIERHNLVEKIKKELYYE